MDTLSHMHMDSPPPLTHQLFLWVLLLIHPDTTAELLLRIVSIVKINIWVSRIWPQLTLFEFSFGAFSLIRIYYTSRQWRRKGGFRGQSPPLPPIDKLLPIRHWVKPVSFLAAMLLQQSHNYFLTAYRQYWRQRLAKAHSYCWTILFLWSETFR